MKHRALAIFVHFLSFILSVRGLICHQCEGWRGHKDTGQENSCLKYNNNCETGAYCVKITEPMTKESTYEPYRSECWHQNNLVVGPGNSTTVENACYTFYDQATPPKRWTYCFCNNKDYCNHSNSIFISILPFTLLFLLFYEVLNIY